VQARLEVPRVALGRGDAPELRTRLEQDDRGAIAADDGGDRARDVHGHLVGGADVGQRVRQLEQRGRGLRLNTRLFDRDGRVESGRDEPAVGLEHDPLLWEEAPDRTHGAQASVAPALGLHFDDEITLVGVVCLRQQLARQLIGLVVTETHA